MIVRSIVALAVVDVNDARGEQRRGPVVAQLARGDRELVAREPAGASHLDAQRKRHVRDGRPGRAHPADARVGGPERVVAIVSIGTRSSSPSARRLASDASAGGSVEAAVADDDDRRRPLRGRCGERADAAAEVAARLRATTRPRPARVRKRRRAGPSPKPRTTSRTFLAALRELARSPVARGAARPAVVAGERHRARRVGEHDDARSDGALARGHPRRPERGAEQGRNGEQAAHHDGRALARVPAKLDDQQAQARRREDARGDHRPRRQVRAGAECVESIYGLARRGGA